jgi:tryptophan synthase alpha subunit
MRKAFIALSTAAFAIGAFGVIDMASAAAVKKTTKGCIVGKEVWNAVDGKCAAKTPVKAAKKAVKKA